MGDLTMWKTVGANEKNIIQPMSAEGIKQLRDLLTYRNDVRGPGLAYFSPERALALIAAYDAAEARAEKAEANVARLTKERDWLATQLACVQSAYDIDQKTRDWSTARWAEAASRAVEGK